MTTNTQNIVYLSAAGGGFRRREMLAAKADMPRVIAGQPCSYYWKDLISPGEYQNAARGFTLSAGQQRLEHWAQTGRQMIAAGINIPIVCDHSEKARDTVGRVIDFRMEADRLEGLCQFIGADAPAIAARNEVSIGVCEQFIDGQGKDWGDAIIHVALTPVPVVAGQQPFVKAASRGTVPVVNAVQSNTSGAAGIVLMRAIDGVRPAAPPTTLQHFERRDSMSKTLLPCSKECLAAMHRHVPGLAQARDEEKLPRLMQHVSSFKASLRKLCDMPEEQSQDAAESDENDAKLLSHLAQKLELAAERAATAEARVLELQRGPQAAAASDQQSDARVDPEMLRDRADLTLGRIDLALSRGELTPAIASKLKARIHSAGKPNVYLLSRNDELGMRPVDFFLDLLAGQRLVPIGSELSGAQTLSRTLPSDDPTPADEAAAALPFKTMAARHNARMR